MDEYIEEQVVKYEIVIKQMGRRGKFISLLQLISLCLMECWSIEYEIIQNDNTRSNTNLLTWTWVPVYVKCRRSLNQVH